MNIIFSWLQDIVCISIPNSSLTELIILLLVVIVVSGTISS
ncbi:MAG: hypothetical protein N4A48_12320 [Tepidibacter sp.]|nr:hypothetical protein [Tepidibacter sp.]MCT4509515.1 hypothetical protein [Tepidibacter sp.]